MPRKKQNFLYNYEMTMSGRQIKQKAALSELPFIVCCNIIRLGKTTLLSNKYPTPDC